MTDHPDDKTQTHVFLTPGTMVSHYRIIEKVGAGGMGEVYLAEDTELDRNVALKFLNPRLSEDDECRRRFKREAKAAARLTHPNVIHVYEVSEYQGRPFFVMEFVDGQPLSDLIESSGMELSLATEIVEQITDALIAAHEKGIVHRDIKPANIVIDTANRPRLVDFGLAHIAVDDRITREGSTIGTLAYMSPEQVEGKTIDARTDIYSLGIVLYEILTGNLPFRRDNEAATINAILNESMPSISASVSSDAGRIDRVIASMTARNPDDRFKDARAVKHALQHLRIVREGADEPEPGDISVAVLPFANMSADPDQEYFCDGIAEDIINDLTQIPGLRVVARTSAFAFKGKNLDVRQVGRQLSVGHVLEGSVRRAGNRVRITAQLVKVSDGYHLWSERYDRNLDDIFAIQDDISRTIVETLKIKLTGARKSADGTEEAPVDAYNLCSQGRYQLNLRTPNGFERALALFNEAVREYPDYPLAHVGLADTYFLLFAYDIVEPRDAISKARNAAQRAIELNKREAAAYTTLAGILTYYDWAWEEAEEAFRKALTYGPGYAAAHQWYGELLSFLGRREEAEERLLTSLNYDPLSTIIHTMLGFHYIRYGNPKEALVYLDKAVELGTDNDATFAWSGLALLTLGEHDAAKAKFDEGCRRSDNGPYSIALRGHGRFLMGELESARAALDELNVRKDSEYVPESYLSTLCFDVGDDEAGCSWLEKAIRRHNTELIFMATAPYYANIRENPRASAMLSILGLKA